MKLLTTIILSLLFFVDYGFTQTNVNKPLTSDQDKNVIIVLKPIERDLINQKGVQNYLMIWDNNTSLPYLEKIDQHGKNNKITIWRFTFDSTQTLSNENNLSITQKGDGNRATVIQN